jgi:hypothetical protein
MNERHARYLLGLRARHAAELDSLRRALAGRRPGLLRAFRKGQAATERETAKIFTAIDRREGSHEGNEERA